MTVKDFGSLACIWAKGNFLHGSEALRGNFLKKPCKQRKEVV